MIGLDSGVLAPLRSLFSLLQRLDVQAGKIQLLVGPNRVNITHSLYSLRCAGNLLALTSLLFLPTPILIKRFPAGCLAFNLGHDVLLLGLAAVADNGRVAFRVLLRRIHQIGIFRIYLISMRNQLRHQRCPGLTFFRELTGSQKQPAGAIAQDVGVFHLFALQLGHGYRIHLGRSRFAVFQQFTGVLAFAVGTAEKLAETAGLELHFRAALVTFDTRSVIALDAEAALFNLIA